MRLREPQTALKGPPSPLRGVLHGLDRALKCLPAREANPPCSPLPKGSERGFTLVELMAVCTILALALVVSLPMGLKWLEDYRYSAACRSFYNAVHLAKINAISGSTLFTVTTIAGVGSDLEVTTDDFYFRCDHTPDINTEGDYPVGQGTSVALAGFIDPSYVNGNVFVVKEKPTVVDGPEPVREPDPVTGEYKGKYRAKLTLKLYSDRVQWTGGPLTSNTGKAWTVATAKFVPTDTAENLPVYSVRKTGGTVECEFDPSLYYVEVNGNNAASVDTPIVFDSDGSPKDLVPYTILIRRMKSGGTVATQGPPFTITVQASGKILSGG